MQRKTKRVGLLISSVATLLLLTVCDGIKQYTIAAGPTEVVTSTGPRVDNTTVYESRLHNPDITGFVTLPRPEVAVSVLGELTVACCTRSRILADGNYFLNGGSTGFLSITEPVDLWQGDNGVYVYALPTINLPGDGTPVQLRLEVDGETKVSGYVQLAADVILLPVHVHILTVDGSLPRPWLSQERVQTWFDYHSIETSATTINEGGRSRTELRTKPLRQGLYAPVDRIWNLARIQFTLASYDVVTVDPELEQQVTSNLARGGLPTSSIHSRYRDIAGMHIYVGRNISNDLNLGQTDGPLCTGDPRRGYAIAMAWNLAEEHNNISLAHEIGHFLGLDHIDGERVFGSCGVELLGTSTPARNLMRRVPFSSASDLSEEQILAARAMACRWLTEWETGSPACAESP